MKIIFPVFLAIAGLSFQSAWGRKVAAIPRLGVSGRAEVSKPLKITGQTRNLSMMLVLQKSKNKIRFVNERKDYSDLIAGTRY